MTISMFSITVPVFTDRLTALGKFLAKGAENAQERRIDPAVLLQSRLAPDMLPLIRQVQIATDHAKGAPSRLAGREVPKFEDNEATFAELQDRIARTKAHLAGFTEADFAGSEERAIALKTARGEMNFDGRNYLLGFAMPNFYFHVTTAYAILRHNGVPLGKVDFIAT